MLTRLLSYHQVMPGYLDFLHGFGAQDNARGKFFTGFYQQTILGEDSQLPQMSDRSWRQYQLCYNLRGVTSKPTTDGRLEWSVRQAAFHHQFDVVNGTTVWIVTKGRKDLLGRYDGLTKDSRKSSFETPQACFRTTLDVHHMFCRWAAENWRQYNGHLEDELNSDVSLAVRANASL